MTVVRVYGLPDVPKQRMHAMSPIFPRILTNLGTAVAAEQKFGQARSTRVVALLRGEKLPKVDRLLEALAEDFEDCDDQA